MGQVHESLQWARMIVRLPLPTPSSMGYFYSTEWRRKVSAQLAAKKFDLIFVHCSSVAQYVEHVTDMPKILDFGDMDSQKWLEYANYKPFPLSMGYRLEGAKMLAAEKRLARRFDLCTATTRAEWETLKGYGTGAATDWFPNGVDAGFFCPTDGAYNSDTISFIGRMDYYPNQECMSRFCEQVWPLLKAQRPAMKLLIVGADPSPAMRRWAPCRASPSPARCPTCARSSCARPPWSRRSTSPAARRTRSSRPWPWACRWSPAARRGGRRRR